MKGTRVLVVGGDCRNERMMLHDDRLLIDGEMVPAADMEALGVEEYLQAKSLAEAA